MKVDKTKVTQLWLWQFHH